MKWKVVSTETKERDNQKITVEKKQLTLTIGDIVGTGKNALSAIQSANKAIPALIAENPNVRLGAIQSSLGLLTTLITGMDVYKNVMKAVEIATPVVQLAARLSGIWASPLNIGEVAQIALGQVEKILIQLAISAIMDLKDFVWNYEFVLKELKTENIEKIEENIKNLQKKLEKALKESINQGNVKIEMPENNVSFDELIDWGENKSKTYITELKIDDNNKRMLRGSLINEGIEYSDDGGKTWKMTEKTDGSWNSFAKINVNNSYIYIAGGIDYIKSIVLTNDKKILDSKNYYYKEDENILEYTYAQKDNLNVKNAYEPDKKEFIKSQGVAYSEDNGYSWNIIENLKNECVNDLCEFDIKTNKDGTEIPQTVTMSSNDFNGAWYTTDGKLWQESSVSSGKWIDVESYENDKKFISILDNKQNSNINDLCLYIGKFILFNNMNVNFNMNNYEVEKRK